MFGSLFTQFKKEPKDKDQQEVESFVPPQLDDAIIADRLFGGMLSTSTSLSFGANGQGIDESTKITNWRSLAKCPEISWAVSEITSEAIIVDSDDMPCQIIFEEDSALPDATKTKIGDGFRHILKLLEFKTNGQQMFKQWLIDGKAYHHGVLDPENNRKGVIDIRWLDPRNTRLIVETETINDPKGSGAKLNKIVDSYYVYSNDFGYKTSTYGRSNAFTSAPTLKQTIKVSPNLIAYSNSGEFIEKGDGTNFAISILDAAVKPYNMLTALEQAMTIYRIARAPERRVIYVDTGNLNYDKADQYMSRVMQRFKKKLVFNSATGELSGESNDFGVLDDYWLPRKEGGRGTEISTLNSGTAWSDMNDLDWFQKKVMRALQIPFSRFSSEPMFSSGRSMEITREEVKFAKFINSLRNRFSMSLIELLRIHLVATNTMSLAEFNQYRGDIFVKWKTDAYWDESLFNEMWQQRVQLANQMAPFIGKYISNAWVEENVFQFSEEEREKMKKEIMEEQKDPRYAPKEDETSSF
jgi:hypothetical protein